MTIWNPTAINPNLPIYLSIADALGEDITRARCVPAIDSRRTAISRARSAST